jgi:Protein of unknown function (DUF3999)
MIRTLVGLVLLLVGARSIQAAESSPQSFAFGLPISTPTPAAAYRVEVPLAVYQHTFREDLADLRVFNAQRDPVPYSLLRKPPSPNRAIETQLPLFSLPSGSRVVIDGVRVTIDTPGSAVNLRTQTSGVRDVSVNQYILDGRTLDKPIVALRLDWPQTDTAYSGHLRVEASDDLSLWRTVVAAAPIVNLRADDRAIIQNRVPLPATAAKFWRMTWIGAAPAFALNATFAESTDVPQSGHALLAVTGTRDAAAPDDYLFDLGAHPPVDRVTLLLPAGNTLVNAELSSRRSARDPWHPVTRMSIYRLTAADGEVKNSPAEIDVDRDRYWRVRWTPAGAVSQSSVQLQVEWVADEVTFLAHGPGPYLLAYGSSAAMSDEADLARIPASIEIAAAALGAPVSLGGPSRLSVQAPPFPRTRFILWSVLVLAVIGLGWMAYRLVKESAATG